jgi:hypothetical protein
MSKRWQELAKQVAAEREKQGGAGRIHRYSNELKRAVVFEVKSGRGKRAELARALGLSAVTVREWCQKRSSFIEATPESDKLELDGVSSSAFTLRFPGGAIISGLELATVSQLLRGDK